MLGDESMSAESHITKVSFIGKEKRWAIQYAGNPTHAWSLTLRIIKKIEGKPQDPLSMSDAVQLAFQEEVEWKINAEILSPFGIKSDEFVEQGLRYFGEDVFRELASKVSKAQLKTALLAEGFPTLLCSSATEHFGLSCAWQEARQLPALQCHPPCSRDMCRPAGMQ